MVEGPEALVPLLCNALGHFHAGPTVALDLLSRACQVRVLTTAPRQPQTNQNSEFARSDDASGYMLCSMTGKKLRGATVWALLVLASIAFLVGMFAHDQWMTRLGVIFLVILGLIALTDWMHTAAK